MESKKEILRLTIYCCSRRRGRGQQESLAHQPPRQVRVHPARGQLGGGTGQWRSQWPRLHPPWQQRPVFASTDAHGLCCQSASTWSPSAGSNVSLHPEDGVVVRVITPLLSLRSGGVNKLSDQRLNIRIHIYQWYQLLCKRTGSIIISIFLPVNYLII